MAKSDAKITILLILTTLVINFSHVRNVCGENILWLSGLASPSHQIWVRLLQITLANRGYNITVLSPDTNEKYKTENLTFLHMNDVYKFYDQKSKNLNGMTNNNPMNDVLDLANFRTDSCLPALKSCGVKQLMDYPKSFKFSLVVHDFAGSQCLLGFVPRFNNPPLVGVSASTCPLGIASVSGNPLYPALTPSNQLRVGYSMNFITKMFNVFVYSVDYVTREWYMAPKQNNIANQYFNNDTLDIWKIHQSTLLALVNLMPIDIVQPFYQTVIPVGGMHIEKPKPLQPELNDFVSKSKFGIVYFALGTNIKSEYFTPLQVKCFLDAFSRFPSYGFLWKYDPSQMRQALPENVMIRKWMPQNDILGHSATKLFIGHGGALSCHEAAWYGIPQLLLPFIIDQKHNSAAAVERGVAILLDKDNLTADIISEALDQLLHNSSYKENMERLSNVFRDQPQTPLERAVFWIEYATRHGTKWKLRSTGQDMGNLQQMAVDVILVMFLLTILTCSLVYYFLIVKCIRLFQCNERKLKVN